LLVLRVTPTPVVGLTDPVDEIRMSPDALVDCGVVTAVEMTVSASAGTTVITAVIAPRPVVASRDRIRELPFSSAAAEPAAACSMDVRQRSGKRRFPAQAGVDERAGAKNAASVPPKRRWPKRLEPEA